MVHLNPVVVQDIVNGFYQDNHYSASDLSQSSVSRMDSNLTERFTLRKKSHLEQVDLDKLEKRGLADTLSKPVLTKQGFKGHVSASALVSYAQSGFEFDGPDDVANMAKELVQGVAQPLVHLGVLAGFYPFVAMGAKGLSQENKSIKQALIDVKQEIKTESQRLKELKGSLREKNIAPSLAERRCATQSSIRELTLEAAQLHKLIANSPEITQSQAITQSQSDLKSTLDSTQSLLLLKQKQQQLKQERREIWCAAKGMRGMQGAMAIFMVQAGSSLGGFLANGTVSTSFNTIATGVGVFGSGLMAGAQALMMASGMIKSITGLADFRQMRQESRHALSRLSQVNSSVQRALQQKVADDRRIGLFQLMQKVIPGTLLTTGQALMLAWSITSIVCLVSGVATPFGLAMMLGLLLPGVGLTLAAAIPKFGSDAIFEKTFDQRFGANDEESGFNEVAYIQQLPSDQNALAAHANDLHTLYTRIKSASQDELINSLDPVDQECHVRHLPGIDKDIHGRASQAESFVQRDVQRDDVVQVDLDQGDQAEKYNTIYENLAKLDQLEPLAEALMDIKGGRSLFDKSNTYEEKNRHSVLSLKNLKNPLKLRHAQLPFRARIRTTTYKTYHLKAPDQIKTSPLHDKVLETGVELLRESAIRQIRAELRATQKVLSWVVQDVQA